MATADAYLTFPFPFSTFPILLPFPPSSTVSAANLSNASALRKFTPPAMLNLAASFYSSSCSFELTMSPTPMALSLFTFPTLSSVSFFNLLCFQSIGAGFFSLYCSTVPSADHLCVFCSLSYKISFTQDIADIW